MQKRFTLLLTCGILGLIVVGIWLTHHLREKHNSAKREAWYQTVLAESKSAFKPGTPRGEVEQHFRVHHTQFKHMCCVANYRGQPVTLSATYDDLVKIGQEKAPWFCSEHNVYIAFEFNPKSQGEAPETNASDSLKRVSIFHGLEGCM
jgi:hypothetical protein